MSRRLLISVGLVVLPILGAADEIDLDDGRIIEGDIVGPIDGTSLTIRVTIGDLIALERFDRAHILAIHHGQTPHQKLIAGLHAERDALADAGTAEAWMALARRAKTLGEDHFARDCAEQVSLRDRSNIEAHQMLGEVVQNGIWMLPREAAIARGEVFYDGTWMPWSERQREIALAEASKEEAAAARDRLLKAYAQRQGVQNSPLGLGGEPAPGYQPVASDPGYDPGYGFNYGYYGPVIVNPYGGFTYGGNGNGRYGGGRFGGGVYGGGFGVVVTGGGGNGHLAVGFHW